MYRNAMPIMEGIWNTVIDTGFNGIAVVALGNSLVYAKLVKKSMEMAGLAVLANLGTC